MKTVFIKIIQGSTLKSVPNKWFPKWYLFRKLFLDECIGQGESPNYTLPKQETSMKLNRKGGRLS